MIILSIALLFCSALVAHAIPCFPGAEGFGTQTPGGRGGRVIVVTNLNDSGPGSLREACMAKGPRIVVFGVGGTIRLNKVLRVTEPFITIAGQSAPGSGICLRDAGLSVETHDVVIRFIRVRIGASLNEEPGDQNPFEASGENCYNMVIDHCSFSWSVDENVGIVSGAHDSTFCYNIVSEALAQPFTPTQIGKDRSHSMALIMGNNPNHLSVYRNLIAHNNSRNPRIQGGTHDFINNVVYDWGFLTATFSRNPQVNFIGNYYKSGPGSRPMEVIVNEGDDHGTIYVKGNRGPDRPADDLPEWETLTTLDPAKHRSMQPFETVPITITTAEQAYADVLRYAGCRLPVLDTVDARVVRNTHVGIGSKVNRPEHVGGYPDYPYALAPADSDQDGMPDSYEIRHGFDPQNASDAVRIARNGYSNLENYLNAMVDNWMSEKPQVIAYPIPDAVKDSPYTVTVNGVDIPVELSGRIEGAYYARFQFSGTVRAVVSVKGEDNPEIKFSPKRYADDVKTDGNQVSFNVFQAGPRVLAVKAGDRELRPLFVIADEYDATAPPASGFGIFNVKDFGVTCDGVKTSNIQKALDACAASKGGGVVYFGPGVYHTGTIRVGDNTTVYLAPGALIKASENPADFPVDPGQIERGTHGPECSFSRLLLFDRCSNSELTGYGVIDGMGDIIRNKHGRHVQLVDVHGCRNIRIENIVLRNSAEWTLHILGCDKVFVDNLKIMNDWGVSNTDGIDPDGSRNVYINRYTAYCGDDAVAIKTTGNSGFLQPAVNIQVKDSVVMCRKTSYKIGTETYADVHDVIFENCDAVNSSRGIGLWMRDGSTISDVTFRDMNFDLHEINGEGMSGEPIRVCVEKRNGIGKIGGILFDRVHSTSPYCSKFYGMDESKLEGFNFWGCRFNVKPREIKMGKHAVLEIQHAKDFTFKFAYLNWLTEDQESWNGFIGEENTENIFVRELIETLENK